MMHTPFHKYTGKPNPPTPTEAEINQRITDKINEEFASGLDGDPDADLEGDDE